MQALGHHIIFDLFGCPENLLKDVDFIERTLVYAAQKSGATILQTCFEPRQPEGVQGYVLISESHLSIHTVPKESFAAVDIFTCGETVRPQEAIKVLLRELDPKDWSVYEVKRGNIKNPALGR